MTKVTSHKTREWPDLKFVIPAGEEVDLPKETKAAEHILASHGVIEVIKKAKAEPKKINNLNH